MHTRLKELRNYLDISQEEFGKKINLSKPTISAFETQTRNMTDRVLSDISAQFNVNEEWLRHGQGEMFIESDSSVLADLSRKYKLDSLDISILESYLNLTPEEKGTLKGFITSIALSIDDGETAATVDNDEDPIEKELKAYRLELEAEQKGATSSALDDTEKSAN